MAQPIIRAFVSDLALDRLPSLAAAERRYDEARAGFRIGPLRVPPRELARTPARELPRRARARLRR